MIAADNIWRNPGFRIYLGSTAFSGVAFAMQQLLLSWILIGILELPATQVGMIQALAGIPGIFLMLLGGASADGRDPRALLIQVYSIAPIMPLLLIAIINFTNLATARSAGRTLEVGLRKTVGAQRSQLVLQFLAESLLVACMTMPVTFVFIQLGLPWMNTVLEKSLVFDLHAIITHGPALATIVLVVGVASGAYPALFLSGFKPIAALNSRMQVRSAVVRCAVCWWWCNSPWPLP